MKSKLFILFLIAFIATASVVMNGCRRTSFDPTPLAFNSPQGFPQPAFNTGGNPSTEEGFQLGKKLFFDGRLSADGNYPCASCHQPAAAFTTYEHDRSHGIYNSHTLRNAPGLFNLAWLPEYNQDGSAKTLAEVYRKHITDPTEMGETIPSVLNKLKADGEYKRMFTAAFSDDKITEDRMYNAVTQYLMQLVSASSKYDKMKAGQATFDSEEQAGYALFQTKCAACHAEPLFTNYSYRNTGLEVDPFLDDAGRMKVTGNRSDSLKFRVPSLRNAEFTSYYGHDGRYSFVRTMIRHYRTTVQQSPTLDPLLANGIPLTTRQEDQLVAFIRTLSDSTFLNSTRFRQ